MSFAIMPPSPFSAAIFTVLTGLAVAQVRPFPRPLAIPMANQAAAAAGRPTMMMMMAGPAGGQAAAPPAPPRPVVTRAQLRNQEVWRTDVAYMTTAFLTISSIYFWVLSKVQRRSAEGDGSRVVLVPRTDSPIPLETLGWILDAVATRDTHRCVDALICALSSKRRRDLSLSQNVLVEFFGSMRNFIAVERDMPRARLAFAAALGRARNCQSIALGCPVDVEKLALHV